MASLRSVASDAFYAWLKDPLNPDLIAKKQQADDAVATESMRYDIRG
jgi:hypothetical protein